MKRFYFAWIFCPDRLQRVIASVTSNGYTKADMVDRGVDRADRWGMVRADTAAAARDAFRADSGVMWFS